MGRQHRHQLGQNGGSLALTTPGKNPLTAFDGDDATYYSHQTRNPLNPGGNVLTVDIGGAVWLEQVRLTGSGMRGYIMRASAGGRDVRGGLKWQRISPPEREYSVAEALPRGDSGRFSSIVDPQDPPLKVRLLDLIVFAHFPPGFVGGRSESGAGQGILVNAFWSSITEIMLFSSRPPAEVVLESDLIELPGLVALGAVRWDADTPLGTDVEIRTRTGDQLLQQIRYFDKTGNEKTADEYRTLAGFLKGPSDTTVVVGPGWSAWSQQYRQPGELASSPSLRRFMQLQVRLKNDGGQQVPALHRLAVELHQPVVQRLCAEVWPTAVEAGVLDTFALFVQPDFLAQPANMRSLGFDEVRVRAEPGWTCGWSMWPWARKRSWRLRLRFSALCAVATDGCSTRRGLSWPCTPKAIRCGCAFPRLCRARLPKSSRRCTTVRWLPATRCPLDWTAIC